MRRVGLKRARSESSQYHREDVSLTAPKLKRARLSSRERPQSRGFWHKLADGFQSIMTTISNKLFPSRRRASDEEKDTKDTDSVDSFESCLPEDTAAPLLLDDSVGARPSANEIPLSSMSVSTPLPTPTTSFVGGVRHTSLTYKPHHSIKSPPFTSAKTQHRSLFKKHPKTQQRAPHTPHRPLYSQPDYHTSILSTSKVVPSTTGSFVKPTPLSDKPLSLSNRPHPLSSTPFSSSMKHRHTNGHSLSTVPVKKEDDNVDKIIIDPSFRQEIIPDIIYLPTKKVITPKSEVEAPGKRLGQTPENIGPVSSQSRPPPRMTSGRGSGITNQIAELQDWFQGLLTTRKDAQSNREMELELAENRLRTSRAERMALEKKRAARLQSLITSPRVHEPTKLNFDLSSDQLQKVTMATRGTPGGACVSTAFNISLTRSDICTLVGLSWLNDNVVNFYFNLIKAAHPSVHVMSSFFYPKLSQSGYTSVRRWTRKVDIFSMDLVLFPIHLGMHWCLAAADFRTSTLSYYDSLLGDNTACLSRLKNYLEDESENKKGTRHDFSSWALDICKDIPTQENGSDCGVFMCMYGRHLAKEVPFNFNQRDCPSIRQHMMLEILETKLLD